jgi:hypothetical protein
MKRHEVENEVLIYKLKRLRLKWRGRASACKKPFPEDELRTEISKIVSFYYSKCADELDEVIREVENEEA